MRKMNKVVDVEKHTMRATCGELCIVFQREMISQRAKVLRFMTICVSQLCIGRWDTQIETCSIWIRRK